MTSHTPRNPNRDFWSCEKKKCGFFMWLDEPYLRLPGGENALQFFQTIIPNRLAANFLPGDLPQSFEARILELDGVTVAKSAAAMRRQVGEGARELRVKMRAHGGVESAAVSSGVSIVMSVPDSVLQALEKISLTGAGWHRPDGEVRGELSAVLPAHMCEMLMEFQWEDILFALRRDGRALIADDMGLGKTLQAIAVARIYRGDWPLLIICPASLRFHWRDELLLWLGEDIGKEDINVVMKGPDAKKPFKLVNVVSYALAQKLPESELAKCNFIICDESHYLKTGRSKRSKFIIPLVQRVPRLLMLSGTPAPSRPVELFSQISAVDPGLFPDYVSFAKRYCDAHVGSRRSGWKGWNVKGSSRTKELYEILNESCLIRRKKKYVLPHLISSEPLFGWRPIRSS